MNELPSHIIRCRWPSPNDTRSSCSPELSPDRPDFSAVVQKRMGLAFLAQRAYWIATSTRWLASFSTLLSRIAARQ